MRAFNAEGTVQTADGEKLTLVCDFSTIDVVEGITGEKWDDILPQLVDPPRALLVKVLYGLLRKRHEGITLDEAAGVMFDKNRAAVMAVMGDVIRRACNFVEDEEAKDENPPKRRGRSRSSAKNG
jgi:hypothetical protein